MARIGNKPSADGDISIEKMWFRIDSINDPEEECDPDARSLKTSRQMLHSLLLEILNEYIVVAGLQNGQPLFQSVN